MGIGLYLGLIMALKAIKMMWNLKYGNRQKIFVQCNVKLVVFQTETSINITSLHRS